MSHVWFLLVQLIYLIKKSYNPIYSLQLTFFFKFDLMRELQWIFLFLSLHVCSGFIREWFTDISRLSLQWLFGVHYCYCCGRIKFFCALILRAVVTGWRMMKWKRRIKKFSQILNWILYRFGVFVTKSAVIFFLLGKEAVWIYSRGFRDETLCSNYELKS